MNIFEDVWDLPDGTYLLKLSGLGDYTIENYAEKWAYGYIVGVEPLGWNNLKNYTLFGVWTKPEGGKDIDVVHHIDALQDATAFARDHDQAAIWDLRAGEAVYV